MNKEQIFTNPKDINELPIDDINQDIEITPQEVLDFFTNNTEEDKKKILEKESKPKPEILNDKGDVKLTISRKEWKESGLDDISLNEEATNEDPASNVPLPEIDDTLLSNEYTNELLHNTLRNTTQAKMLYDLSKVTINDIEKEQYLRRVLLADQPLRLSICIGDPKLNIRYKCTSKTIEIQNLLQRLIDEYVNERDNEGNYVHNTFESGMFILKLNAIFCVDIPNIKKVPLDITFEEQKEIVKENLNIINSMSFAKWNVILNVMRIFEQKEALLGAELISGDF